MHADGKRQCTSKQQYATSKKQRNAQALPVVTKSEAHEQQAPLPTPPPPPTRTPGAAAVVKMVQVGMSQATQQMTPQEINKAWASYSRSLAPASPGDSLRKERCPADVALKIASLDERKRWFHIWLESNRSWGKAIATEEARKEQEKTQEHKKVWMTLDQCKNVFKSQAVGQAIFDAARLNPSTWRPHPLVPHIQEAVQCKIAVEDAEFDRVRDIISRGTRFETELDQDASQILLQKSFGESGVSDTLPPVASASSGQSSLNEAVQAMLDAAKQKEASDKLKKEKAAEARAKAQEEAKRKRESFKQTPKYKAQEWIPGVAACLTKSQAYINKTQAPQSISPDICKAFHSDFESYQLKLERLRTCIEHALGGSDDEALAQPLAEGLSFIENIKRSAKSWDSLAKSSADE